MANIRPPFDRFGFLLIYWDNSTITRIISVAYTDGKVLRDTIEVIILKSVRHTIGRIIISLLYSSFPMNKHILRSKLLIEFLNMTIEE